MKSENTTYNTHFCRFGAATAIGVWLVASEYPLALATFGFFYSIPCFYYIVARPEYAITGRFVLLTYNLTCLNWYVYRMKKAYARADDLALVIIFVIRMFRFWTWRITERRLLLLAWHGLPLFQDFGGRLRHDGSWETH